MRGIKTDTKTGHIFEGRRFPFMVWTLRVLLGSLFIVSGLTKGIDLWGVIFKIDDYLAVWKMMQPRSLVVIGALLLSGYEFVFGVLLATGCYKRVAVWALTALMVFMLPLTAYIVVASPVNDCGCFGDFLVISNTATFVKNIFITAGLIILLKYNRGLRKGLFKPAIQWVVAVVAASYFIIVSLYGYNVQPMVDFRPYPIGAPLLAADSEETDDGDSVTFIYEKDGENREFGIDELPDSTWRFVNRIENQSALTAKGEGSDFVIYDGDGNDVSYEAITGDGTELLVIIPEPRRIDISYTYFLNELKQWADTTDVGMVCLIASNKRGIDYWKDISMASYEVYSAEDTKLKELSRGTMSLVELHNGCVAAKYTLSSIDEDVYDNGLRGRDLLERMKPDSQGGFKFLCGVTVLFLLLLFLFQNLVLALYTRIKKIYQKKAVNLQSKSPGEASGC